MGRGLIVSVNAEAGIIRANVLKQAALDLKTKQDIVWLSASSVQLVVMDDATEYDVKSEEANALSRIG